MSGYVASARILRASPRLVRHGPVDRGADWPGRAVGAVVILDAGARMARPSRVSLGERWSRFHDRWNQLTFFLTDPDSWR